MIEFIKDNRLEMYTIIRKGVLIGCIDINDEGDWSCDYIGDVDSELRTNSSQLRAIANKLDELNAEAG